MFSKKTQIDVKKSLQKFLDVKKDSFGRLRHLRVIIENAEIKEIKDIFEHQFSHIYHIFYESFITLDASLKQRGHKINKEELDAVFIVFEKILTLVPELLKKQCQIHSIAAIMKKLLHHGNTVKIRQEGMRLFLIWFQIIGDSATNELEQIYLSLVPGLIPGMANNFLSNQQYFGGSQYDVHQNASNTAVFGDSNANIIDNSSDQVGGFSVQAAPVEPFMPSFNAEPPPTDITCYYLQCLLDYMISQISKVFWKEKCELKQMKCFEFLLQVFRKYYLPHIFLSMKEISLYKPYADLPGIRVFSEEYHFDPSRYPHRDTLINCQAVVIRWITKYMRSEINDPTEHKELEDNNSYSKMISMHSHLLLSQETILEHEPTLFEYDVFRTTFNSNRTYVNLMHSLFYHAFLLPFTHATTMRRVTTLYREWIYKTSALPLFLEEPLQPNSNYNNEDVRAGTSSLLRVFVTISANVFLLELPFDKPLLLEEQVDMCKRVLNIYRYMVMKIDMDKATWEQLLNVMLQITSLVLKENIPLRKEETLGGRLAPALFQTLIVTWIKANLNVTISMSLWEKFHLLVSSLTCWEELVKEWCKTMDTLTRVMSRYVYNINLNDLPLERPSERIKKKSRAIRTVEMKSDKIIKVNETNQKNADEKSSDKKSAGRMRSNSGEVSSSVSSRKTSAKSTANKLSRSKSDTFLVQKANQTNQSMMKSKEYLSNYEGIPNKEGPEKARSLELIYNRIESPIWSDSSASRSPSPASNVTESSSLKDSPMNIEANNSNNFNNTLSKSVMIGGTYKGWCHESAIILWRRMLGILGDINKLSDPAIHSLSLECLAKITEDLIKVRENLSFDSSSTLLIPPIHFISPWLFKATQLPNEYKSGKLLAYKLLCLLTLRKNDFELSKEYLALFYNTIHQGLSSFDMDIISAIIKYSGPKFFSLGLPGSSCLVFDFINSANSIIQSSENKLPRCEALNLMGSLIGFQSIFANILVLQPRSAQPNLMHYKDAKEHILDILLSASKKEQTGLGRSIALNSLGIFLYQELHNRSNHPRLQDITNVLIAGTKVSLKIPKITNLSDSDSDPFKFNNRVLCRIACDMLSLQSDHATYLLDNHPEIPKLIINGLCSTLSSHFTMIKQQKLFKEFKNVLLTIMFCLGLWFMSVPKLFLQCCKLENSDNSLLSNILKVLTDIAIEKLPETSTVFVQKSPSPINENEIDFTINENFNDVNLSPTIKKKPGFMDNNQAFENRESGDANTVRLAAKLLIGYITNYLSHFPQQNLGASKLSCFINENDDNYHVSNIDTLDLDTFNSPNVLFLLINNTSIVSFVELFPSEEEESESQNVSLNSTPVRVITRNLLGKFAWDCRQMHSVIKNKFNVSEKFTRGLSLDNEDLQSHQNRDVEDDDEDEISLEPDELEILLKHLTKTSPECINLRDIKKPTRINNYPEAGDLIALLTNQHFQESRFVEERTSKCQQTFYQNEGDSQVNSISEFSDPHLSFQRCRQFIDHLGFLFWEKRNRIDLLTKNQSVVREIRNLDNQKCRETHKIAVIYVGKGQEDKKSILLNSVGSRAFEEFVAGLGWEINLETHLGFRGGLQQNNSTGKSTPYYANAFTEVIFHVSTRISAPNESENEIITKKMRHLGNDEVFIVWSEHTKDYRRGIIPTEFCDVLIIIYPLRSYSGLYYIQVSRKPEVPFIGPLFNGVVVHHDVLPGLVRATAINASRAKRMHIPYYLNYFEERARSIEAISKNHREKSCFEDFASRIYSPRELDIIFSRPLSALSSITDTISISSNVTNIVGSQPQTPQAKSRPLSMTSVEQKTPAKTNFDRPISAASHQSNSPI